MDETWMLLLLVIVMLVGSYLAGNIPLVVTLSEVCWSWCLVRGLI